MPADNVFDKESYDCFTILLEAKCPERGYCYTYVITYGNYTGDSNRGPNLLSNLPFVYTVALYGSNLCPCASVSDAVLKAASY